MSHHLAHHHNQSHQVATTASCFHLLGAHFVDPVVGSSAVDLILFAADPRDQVHLEDLVQEPLGIWAPPVDSALNYLHQVQGEALHPNFLAVQMACSVLVWAPDWLVGLSFGLGQPEVVYSFPSKPVSEQICEAEVGTGGPVMAGQPQVLTGAAAAQAAQIAAVVLRAPPLVVVVAEAAGHLLMQLVLTGLVTVTGSASVVLVAAVAVVEWSADVAAAVVATNLHIHSPVQKPHPWLLHSLAHAHYHLQFA